MPTFSSIDDYATRCLAGLEFANTHKFYERPFDKYDGPLGQKSLEMQAQISQLPAIPNNVQTIQNYVQNMMIDLDQVYNTVVKQNHNNIPANKQEGFLQRFREGYVFSSVTKLFNDMNIKFGAQAAKDFQKFAKDIAKTYIAVTYSPRIDASCFAAQQLSGISVLTDPNAEGAGSHRG